MHDKVTVGRIDEARQVLKAPDVSSDRLDHSLGKYVCPVPHEKLAFAGFLRAWPMYDEGAGHRDKKLGIVSAMRRSAPHAERVAAAVAAEVAGWREADSARIVRLNDTWQAGFMGLSQQDYDAVSEQFGLVTAFFANRSNLFPFDEANGAIDAMRRFWEPERFIPGSLLAECAALGLARDTTIGLVVDARPSVARALEALFHSRLTWPAELVRSIAPRVAAERILLEHPPFGSINRLRIDEAGRPASELSVDIVLCNRDGEAGRGSTGLTFGFGRHGCPAGDPVTSLLAAVWQATVEGWPEAAATYEFTSVPGRHGTVRIERQHFVL